MTTNEHTPGPILGESYSPLQEKLFAYVRFMPFAPKYKSAIKENNVDILEELGAEIDIAVTEISKINTEEGAGHAAIRQELNEWVSAIKEGQQESAEA